MAQDIGIELEDGRKYTYYEGNLYGLKVYCPEDMTSEDFNAQVGESALWIDEGGYDGDRAYTEVGVLERDLSEVLATLNLAGCNVLWTVLTEAGQSGDSCNTYSYFPVGAGWFVYYSGEGK